MLAVRHVEGQGWQYSDNQTWRSFNIQSGDRLLASIDFTNDTMTSLLGASGKVRGIDSGFAAGDLGFIADSWNGVTEAAASDPAIPDGEFEATGTYFVIDDSRFPKTQVGNLNRGIAVDDAATGTGFIMYSNENVHTRFGGAVWANSSEHLVAVRHNGTSWQFNTNYAWVNFTPVASDRLLAEVNFFADTAKSLQGQNGIVKGIAKGFVGGDLEFFADRWNGVANDGEFEVTGTFFTADAPLSVGELGRGVAVDDAATGTGFLMYSEQNLFTRFGTSDSGSPNAGVAANNAEHFVAVRFNAGVWQYNTDFAWADFTPQSGDRLMATLDFDADQGTALRGVVGTFHGITMGFQRGDLAINGNLWNGATDLGEFQVVGTYFTEAEFTEIGNLGRGIAVDDAATGTGFVMYSEQSLFSRFGISSASSSFGVHPSNAEHLVAVRYHAGNWQYNTNYVWVNFTPATGDRLLATIDFDADKMSSLKGTSGNLMGMESGFEFGDLRFKANSWDGSYNLGEFQVTGSYFTIEQEFLGATQVSGSGNIAVDDAATGTGFIMYSDVAVHSRFANVWPTAGDHFIAVRYNGTVWQFNSNTGWLDFTPVAGDRLVASVDFDADTVTSLKGQGGNVSGISRGFTDGDLAFHANQFNGVFNLGEFEVTGSYFLS